MLILSVDKLIVYTAAAHSLGGIVDTSKPGVAVLPPVSKIQSFSQKEAEAVAQSAIDQTASLMLRKLLKV